MHDAVAAAAQDLIVRFMRWPLWCQVSTWHLRKDPGYRAAEYRYKTHRGMNWMPR